MRKFFTVILLLLPVILSGANPKFIEFTLQQAHSKGFFGCDEAIKDAFKNAGGNDIRVNTDWFKETKKDFLKLTSTYGSKGDSIFIEAELRKNNGKCYMTETSIITTKKSCIAYANELKAFKFIAETGDYSWMKSERGVRLLLKPLNGGCIATFQRSNYY